jgi:hypothetical protein
MSIHYCDMYVFNTVNNTIDGILCNEYDPKIHKSILEKEVIELCKLNDNHIRKTIQSLPHHENRYFHVSKYGFSYPLKDNDSTESRVGNDMYMNPYGIWMSCGISWQNFIGNKINTWSLSTYVYEIEVNKSVLKLTKLSEFTNFIEQYKKRTTKVSEFINWKKIKKEHDGLIICPYLGNKIWGKNASDMTISGTSKWDKYIQDLMGNTWKKDIRITAEWYRHWDEGTGVVWRPSTGIKTIKLIKKLDTFDHLNT